MPRNVNNGSDTSITLPSFGNMTADWKQLNFLAHLNNYKTYCNVHNGEIEPQIVLVISMNGQ